MKLSTLVRVGRSVYTGTMVFVFAVALPLASAQEQDRQPMDARLFTGNNVGYTLKQNSTGGIGHIYFPPGSHTKWHSHELGQIIFCEEGACVNAIKGGPVILLHAGETSYAPPGVVHWQGAPPNEGGTQFNISRGTATWFGDVTDEEYHLPTSHIEIVGPNK